MKSLTLLVAALAYLSTAAALSGTTKVEADCKASPDDSSATVVTYPKNTHLVLACYTGGVSGGVLNDGWVQVRRLRYADSPPLENPSIRTCYVRSRKVHRQILPWGMPLPKCKDKVPRQGTPELWEERDYEEEEGDWNEEE